MTVKRLSAAVCPRVVRWIRFRAWRDDDAQKQFREMHILVAMRMSPVDSGSTQADWDRHAVWTNAQQ